jgi:cytochrome c-type biogenesis protein CcmH
LTVFAIVAAVLIAAGLAWLLRPLLGRQRDADIHREASNVAILHDQIAELDGDLAAGTVTAEQHREARAELERRVLDEGRARVGEPAMQSAGGARTAIALAFVIPVAAALLYLQLGSTEAFSPQAASGLPAGHPATGGDHSLTQQEVEQMVEKLAERMKQNPADPQGWAILARTYYVMQRFPEAADAYAKLATLVPDEADVLADYADSLAMAQGRKISGKPLELVHRALKLDPTHWKALAMAGTEAFDRKDYRAAVGFWEKMRGSVPPDSDIAKSIDSSIAEARELGGLKAGAPLAATKPPAAVAAAPAAAAPTAGAASGRVAGTVALSPGLLAQAKPDDVVFIFARPAEGSRMPLAILRRQVKDLPVTFALDDSLAMSPASKLSAFTDVVVGARVSRNGTAMPQSGDLEGLSAPVKVGASGVAVVIDKAVP